MKHWIVCLSIIKGKEIKKYELMKDGQSAGEKKNADICDYLLKILKNRSDISGEQKWS